MGGNKNFAAVWWTKEKKWSVVNLETVVGEKSPGCFSYAMWNGTPFEVKILRISEDFNALSQLKVDSEGGLVIEKALVDTTLNKISTNSNQSRKKIKAVNSSSLSAVFKSGAIGNSGGTSDCLSRTLTEQPKVMTSALIWPPASNEVISYLERVVLLLKNNDAPLKASNAPSTSETLPLTHLVNNPQQTQTAVAQRSPLVMNVSLDSPLKEVESKTNKTSGSTPCDYQKEYNLSFPCPKIDDPIILVPGHNIFVSRKQRNRIAKLHKKDPITMTKEMLLHLLGEDNLKCMHARNRGHSNHSPVPPAVMDAVECFAASYSCSSVPAPTKRKFTKAVNNYCSYLRNPSRDHHSSQGKQTGKDKYADDRETSEFLSPRKKRSSQEKLKNKNSEKRKRETDSESGDSSSAEGENENRTETTANLSSVNCLPSNSPWKMSALVQADNQMTTVTPASTVSKVLDFSQQGSTPTQCYPPSYGPWSNYDHPNQFMHPPQNPLYGPGGEYVPEPHPSHNYPQYYPEHQTAEHHQVPSYTNL